ncbi:MAG: hypothetical protein Q9164_000752 [Protoblastenia rupestris]
MTLGNQGAALAALPQDLSTAPERLSKEGGITAQWTHVSIVKGAYIRGVALEDDDKKEEAVHSYESMLSYLSDAQTTSGQPPEYRLWSERLLARHCMLVDRYTNVHCRTPYPPLANGRPLEPTSILKPYRAWANFWDEDNPRMMGQLSSIDVGNGSLRTRIWKGYYDAISTMVQQQTLVPVFESKPHQVQELKKVEATYENFLLKEVRFPKADQATPEIESWVDQVMANWQALLGPDCKEDDLGSGGKAALGRGVLDVSQILILCPYHYLLDNINDRSLQDGSQILYRAATRSFHSTKVLRHLLTVHAALAEFMLSGKALDSYLEIVTKGKARMEKSGELEPGLDDDATTLCTAASGISMLCVYGKRKEAKRAQEVAKVTETWLRDAEIDEAPHTDSSAADYPKVSHEKPRLPRPPLSWKATAQAYHAIGISKACWARLTYEISSRADLQANAILNLRRALEFNLDDEDKVQTLYSLGFVLAETRNIDGAISAVKQAVSIGTEIMSCDQGVKRDPRNGNTAQDARIGPDQRGLLLRCWHLLILLLSARQNFSTALASCEAAFEPYGGKATLYGDTRPLDSILGLDLCERKNLIELKMTHLALSEVLDSPEESVNASGELLGLFSKLFKPTGNSVPKILEPRPVSPKVGTSEAHRSLRGSILGLPGDRRRSKLPANGVASSSVGSFEPTANDGARPAISVTADGNDPLPQNPNHHQGFLGRHESNKLRKRSSRKSLNSIRRSRADSPSKPPSGQGHHHLSLHLPLRHRQHEQTAADGLQDPSINENVPEIRPYSLDEIGVAMTHNMPSAPGTPQAVIDPPNLLNKIPSAAQNMNHKNPNSDPNHPKPPISTTQNPQTINMQTQKPIPEPYYPPHMQSRHTLALLTKIWLFVSSLYRHASMLPDAQGAISEAKSQVEIFEQSIATHEGSSSENFSSRGYGGLKSCGELWADVLSEQAALYLAQGNKEQASQAYETAMHNCLDHLPATVGLSNMLLDSYAAPPQPDPFPAPIDPLTPTPVLATLPANKPKHIPPEISTSLGMLTRLSARDRAYGLLSALTKSGQGWDSSEAWFALARAYEESGQIEKAKEALWWVVELEEGRGVRGWDAIV